MADIIRLLPDHVANQIAAGEVVQRPASVVKELLENALDAQADTIDLILKDAGKTLIQVVDNGKGMSVSDARMSFERHATSKIKNTQDLFEIRTKGFRGEALASIAAVAQVELRTKDQSSELGTRVLIEGSQVKEQAPVQTHKGAALSVKNLFYNVPARRNFLKSPQIEFRHIIDELHRVALAHPDIVFRVHHNDEMILHLKSGALKQRIVAIFGQKINEQLAPIAEKNEWLALEGFIAKPGHSKKNRGEQFFFVNDRFVRSAYLHKAVLEAYEGLLKASYRPSYFISLSLDPKHIDINIHPTKTEVKFDDEASIYAMLRVGVKRALGEYQLTPALDFERARSSDPAGQKKPSPHSSRITVDPHYNPFEVSHKSPSPKAREMISSKGLYEQIKSSPAQREPAPQEISGAPLLERSPEKNLGRFQLNGKYIITALNSALIVIDQRRAHQRILYERFLNDSRKNLSSRQLLFALEISLSPGELTCLKTLESDLLAMGFVLDFSRDAISIRSVPSDIDQKDVPEFIREVLERMSVEVKSAQESLARSMSKAGAIKHGAKLTPLEIEHLIDNLFECADPNHSPFGKPVFITCMDFIEKQFCR